MKLNILSYLGCKLYDHLLQIRTANCQIKIKEILLVSCLCHLKINTHCMNKRLSSERPDPCNNWYPMWGFLLQFGSILLVVKECQICSMWWVPLGTGISTRCRVDCSVAILSGFLSVCYIHFFGDAFSSKLLMCGLHVLD